jgi:hypothetical protein
MGSKERPLVYVNVDGFQGLPEFTIKKTPLVVLSGQGSVGREDIVSLLSGLLSFLGELHISERSDLFRDVFYMELGSSSLALSRGITRHLRKLGDEGCEKVLKFLGGGESATKTCVRVDVENADSKIVGTGFVRYGDEEQWLLKHILNLGTVVHIPAYDSVEDIMCMSSDRVVAARQRILNNEVVSRYVEVATSQRTSGCNRFIRREQYDSIVELLEQDLLKCVIDITETGAVEFVPQGVECLDPSVVSSAACLVLLLKYTVMFRDCSSLELGDILIENPEMYMSKQQQRVFAKAIVLLANAGVYVTLSTGSEIVLQTISECVCNNIIADDVITKYVVEDSKVSLVRPQIHK